MIAAGVTTVFDSICCGSIYDTADHRKRLLPDLVEAVEEAKSRRLFRADHAIHLRCEVPSFDIEEAMAAHLDSPSVRLVSLMNHTPGQRQWRNVDQLRAFALGTGAESPEQFETNLKARMADGAERFERHLPLVLAMLRGRGLLIATHDDTTSADVALAIAAGSQISEFPTTMIAAVDARKSGLRVVAGAPNVVRGGSHSGGVSVVQLARVGALDGLSSDYAPSSLLQAVALLHTAHEFELPSTMALVTSNMADMLGMEDRGRLRPNLRADLIRFRIDRGTSLIRSVWVEGARVF
jgi:alpha-D-ribose 1-methylphosphonate 5-triphosphate diphosphatase